MEEQLDLLVREKRRGGFSLAVPVSLVLHTLIMYWFFTGTRSVEKPAEQPPIARYVELMRQNPQNPQNVREFTEAPGPAIQNAPSPDAPSPDAPFSDKNRKASTPNPTGDQPTRRPGDGSGGYTPPMPQRGAPPSPAPQQAEQPGQQSQQQPEPQQTVAETPSSSSSSWKQPSEPRATAASVVGGVDWRKAITDVGRNTPAGNNIRGFDAGTPGSGGDAGTADAGPLSFETQWYDWGDYANSMVSQIRYHWYQNMPQIIRTGMKGVVTIRFTIQRSGQITNIELLQSSGVPPYDFAARKAIQLASPLKPLPADFPNPTERVTCMFYYNTPIPAR
ncbi:MAG TPA: TonB family protein [Thermoanaerobaculia bacterium]